MKKPLTAAVAAKEKAKKHAAAEKAARTRAKDKAEHKPVHHAKVKVSHKPVVKRRKWSPDEDVALCSARAVAESLRLALGVRVAEQDVLGLHWAAGGDPDAGASVLDVLSAAQRYGLSGHRPNLLGALTCEDVITNINNRRSDGGPDILLLGCVLPEPHAVTVGPDGTWWSWGQPYKPADFPGAVIEEAWAVTWS